MNDKEMKISLLFGADGRELHDEFLLLDKDMNRLNKKADKLRDAIKLNKAAGKDVKKLKDELKKVDSEMDDILDSARQISSEFDQAGIAVQNLEQKLFFMRDIGSKLNEIGAGLSTAGQAVIAPLKGALEAYMASQDAIEQAGGKLSDSARAYRDAQAQMHQAYTRIGAVAMQELMPHIDKVAELVDDLAAFIEKNPELIEVAASIGVTLATLGGVVAAVGQLTTVMGVLGEVGIMGAGGGFIESMPKAGAVLGKAFVLAAAVGLGAEIGLALGNAIDKATGGEGDATMGDAATTAKQLLAISIAGYMEMAEDLGLATDETTAQNWEAAKAMVGLGDAVEGAGKKAGEASSETGDELTNAKFDAIVSNYNDASIASIEKYGKQRLATIAKFDDLVEQANTTLANSLSKAKSVLGKNLDSLADNFNASERAFAENHAANMAGIRRDGNKELERIEIDHIEAMRQLEMSHDESVLQLADDRDALGLARENDRYEKEKVEKERQKEKDLQGAKNETQERLAEARRVENLRRAQAKQAYNAQVKAAHAQYKEQVALAKKQHEEKLAALAIEKAEALAAAKKVQREERIALMVERNAQLGDLSGALSRERKLKQDYYIAMLNDLRAFGNASISNARPYATGGYASYGAYILGDSKSGGRGADEFVMSGETTQSVERAVGGLTQDKIKSLARGGYSQSSSNKATVNLALPSGIITIPILQSILEQNKNDIAASIAEAITL